MVTRALIGVRILARPRTGPSGLPCAIMTAVVILSALSVVPATPSEAAGGSFGGGSGTLSDPYVIEDVRDLQNMSGNLSAHYVLGNDIDASATAVWNGGAGFEPVGGIPNRFTGSLDGRGHTIRGLYIDRPAATRVGLFGWMEGEVRNVGVVDCDVTGEYDVGGLAGSNAGLVDGSYATGNVTGTDLVGGLIGFNSEDIRGSHAEGNVTGVQAVGGLVGASGFSTEERCHFSGSVRGTDAVGGLVGDNGGKLLDSYAAGTVSGTSSVGGVVGTIRMNAGRVSNSHYDVDVMLINGGHHVTFGGLFHDQFQDWLASGLSLDISDYSGSLVPSGGAFEIDSVQGFRDLMGLADVASHTFRLTADLDLSVEPGLFVPFISAGFDGMNHTISNLRADVPFAQYVGMFGYNGGTISNLGVVGCEVRGCQYVGGLVGFNNGYNYNGNVNASYATGNVSGTCDVGGLVGYVHYGSVSGSHASGNVTGNSSVGGLVGFLRGTVTGSHAAVNVTGGSLVGGLVGQCQGGVVDSYFEGSVAGSMGVSVLVGYYDPGQGAQYWFGAAVNSHYSIAKTTVNGGHHITPGALFDGQFQDWLSSGLSLDISDYGSSLVPSGGAYDIEGVQGLRDLLGFSDVPDYVFRLAADLDLSTAPGLYIPYLACTFEGGYHTVSNLSVDLPFAEDVGLFGINDGGSISGIRVIGSEVRGCRCVGGLVGFNQGTVNRSGSTVDVAGERAVGGLAGVNNFLVRCSYAAGDVTGNVTVGGLVGFNDEYVVDSYAWGAVAGNASVGGLIGCNDAPVESSYAKGSVTGDIRVGGLVGDHIRFGCADRCFWDVEASGRNASDGGTGKTSAEMRTRGTFTDAGWDLERVWCIVDGVTYPILRWQATEQLADAGDDITVEMGTLVTFDGSGSPDELWIVNYTWTLVDVVPVTLYGARPAHRFDDPGVFVVTLCVTNIFGNSGTDDLTVTVVDATAPVADAGPDQTVDAGAVVALDGSGSTDNVGIASYTWTFQDGALVVLEGVHATHRFGSAGTFVVTLNVTDAAGRWATDTMVVTVNDTVPPVADAGGDVVIDQGDTLLLDGSASTDNVGIVSWEWHIWDGFVRVNLSGPTASHTFANPGTFEVSLTVADAAGNTDRARITVTVRDTVPPVADAGPDRTVDERTTVTLDGRLSHDNDRVANYAWGFTYGTDHVILYGAPSFTFWIPGVYTITLNVTDAAGNWGQDSMVLTVKDLSPPVAEAGPDRTVPAGSVVTLDASGSSDNAGIAGYTWTIVHEGEPTTILGKVQSFHALDGGVYEATLTVRDASGNADDDTVTITVVDTGTVKGTVLDQDGRPVEGARVELTASNGTTRSTTTVANGAFALDVHHGAFTWRVAKDGYGAISGASSVDAMGTTVLDLPALPLEKVEERGPSTPLLLMTLIVIATVVAAAAYVLRRRRH